MDGDEDLDVLWCDDCHTSHGLDCPKLGSTIKVQDRLVETRALATLPESLHLKVTDGSRQVVAAQHISRRTQFGPLEARRLDGNQSGSQILYKIFAKSSVVASLDLSDDNCCNWMSLVPLFADPLHQNLVSFQHEGQIYFLAITDIKKGENLCVWYSPNYAAKMTAAEVTNVSGKTQLSTKNGTLGKQSANIGPVEQEKVCSSTREYGKLPTPLIRPEQNTTSIGMVEETRVSGRRRSDEREEDSSGDEDDDYECDANSDGSSYEQMKSSSNIFLQEISSARRDLREEVVDLDNVMETTKSRVNQDGIIAQWKKPSPTLKSPSALSLHNMEHCRESSSEEGFQENESVYDCFLCQVRLSDAEMFISHMVEVHGASSINHRGRSLRYSCHLCTSVLPSPGLLQDHMTSQHKSHMIDPLKCCKCSKVLQNFSELQQHELRHSSLLSVVCHVCGDRFLKGVMDSHLKERHAAVEGYVCLQCGNVSFNLEALVGHVKWHDDWNQERKKKGETGIVGGAERGSGQENELGDSSQLDRENLDEVSGGGCHVEKGTGSEKRQDEEKDGGDVKTGRGLCRLSVHDTRSVTGGFDQSTLGGKELGWMGEEEQSKVGEKRSRLDEEDRKIKRSKLSLEDRAAHTDGEDQSGVNSEVKSLDDKEEKMLKETDSRQPGDGKENPAESGKGGINLSLPMGRYNLRKRGRKDYQVCQTDQDETVEEGVDEGNYKEALFDCHLCKSEFQSKQKLNNHLGVRVHRNGKASIEDLGQYPCTECDSVFYSSRSLALHHGRCHKEAKQECQYCNYKCVAMVTLKEHILSVHKDVDLGISEQFQYPCKDCDLVFLQFCRLTKHMQTHLAKQFKCEKCCHYFSRKNDLQYHTCNPGTLESGVEADFANTSTFQCKYCQKEFDKAKVLHIHVFTHFINVPSRSGTPVLVRVPSKSDKTLTCSHCHGQFNSSNHFVQHVSRAHHTKVFPCVLCFDIFSSHESLLTHLQNHIENDPDRCEPQSILGSGSSCKECFAVFPNESTLQRHMAVHLKTKDFICDVCGKTFSRKDTLETHLKSHDSAKPYQCEICGKYLKTFRSFQIHIDNHSEERKFQCHVCLRGFKQKGNLNKHMSKCVPQQDIRCKYCHLKFKDLDAVASHEEHIHSGKHNADFTY